MLLEEARKQFDEKVSLLSRLRGKKPRRGHLASAVHFLTVDFDQPFDFYGKSFASLHRAMQELDMGTWSAATEPSLSMTREAVSNAIRVRLPLIIDM